MLYILIVLIVLSIILYGWGQISKKWLNPENLFSFTLLKGLLLIGITASIFAFFSSLNLYVEISIALIGFASAIYNKFWISFIKVFNNDYKTILLILTTAFVASMNPYLLDTFSYYLPTIKWLDDYGYVKGLANFDFNLGQHSFWHITQASFNEFIDVYYKLNAVLIVIFILYLKEINKNQYLIFIPVFYLFVASSSPDLAVFVISCISIINYLQYKNHSSIAFGFTMASFLILIKPITFSLFLFFGYLVIKNKPIKKYLPTVTFCAVLGLIFILKNIILTGNPIFPLGFGKVNQLDFGVISQSYEISKVSGRALVIASKENLGMTFEYLKNMNFINYLGHLFNRPNFKTIVYTFFSLINLIFFIYTIIIKNKKLQVLSTILLLKILVFFYISPQHRFVIDTILIIGCVVLYKRKFSLYKYNYLFVVIFGVVFIFTNEIMRKNSIIRSFNLFSEYKMIYLIKPENYGTNTKNITFSNFKPTYSTNYRYSVDAKQPNLNSDLLNKYLFYGFHPIAIDSTNIKKGFRSKENDKKSIIKIEQILNKKDQ